MKRRKKDQALPTNDRPAFLVLPTNTVTFLSCEQKSHKCSRHATSSKQDCRAGFW